MGPIRPCKYQPNVDCEIQAKCGSCGWNPDLKRERIFMMKAARIKRMLEGK